ncbi:glucuronate isomerase [Maribellus luteus]|uniref:Uronate isomerase n=1 Tax=Maribellus luteus TaxID=2305463 RepID=A0A399T8C7_9BACT|nr:glucuronate isomerase [Maribellus luteus]RIJ50411.1 glucuronate isomerase [Maribellus luteus]
MENPIIHPDFLMQSDVARELYHDYAAPMPIIDYHCHLPAQEIAQDRVYKNLTQAWLYGDHYKWRAMRTNGIGEKYITGAASDWEKFESWSKTVPYTVRNPLYHWTHLELVKPFGIKEILNPRSARRIYDNASEQLSSGELSVQAILQKFNVVKVCTTDDPVDSLAWHQAFTKSDCTIAVKPAWRPDKALDVRNAGGFNAYVDKLAEATAVDIIHFEDFINALKQRHEYFHRNGCRVSDHGLEFPFPVEEVGEKELEIIFNTIRGGKELNRKEQAKFMSAMLFELAVWNHEKGWVQQFHVGALRDVNTKGVQNVGQACGFDSIADFNYAHSMGLFLNRLEEQGKLTKTIIYNLNPRDNEMVASMIGNFQDGSVPGKMQFGSGWWFLDQKDGMEKQINALSNQGLLSRFVGMLTDSRSFLSFSRHEYFRRILCNLIGEDVKNGELPKDMELLGEIVQGICYNNAEAYFDL